MTNSDQQNQSKNLPKLPVLDVLKADELKILVDRIEASGELGRSKNYSALLHYLVSCALENRSPREVDIAIDVLGRSDSYDGSSDSTVRVYIHQLRKKLDSYYEKYDSESSYRLVIPKGQYSLAVSENRAARSAAENLPDKVSKSSAVVSFNLNTLLLLSLIVLLLSNLFYMGFRQDKVAEASSVNEIANHSLWQPLFDDDLPIMLVMGDYYIFGELNANGNIARMVREFNVNSRSDLEELQFSDFERAGKYLDLDLSYMPEGSAFALTKIVPILQSADKPFTVTMMSDLTMADIRSHHIVYIGYISALEKLSKMAFAGSSLALGRSYDELFNRNTDDFYTSDAGLPEAGQPFHDYGLFSTFPASSETQVVIISGMRDAGLMHTAAALSNPEQLDSLEAALGSSVNAHNPAVGYEALYEVFGIDRMNFEADLIYTNSLNTARIWRQP